MNNDSIKIIGILLIVLLFVGVITWMTSGGVTSSGKPASSSTAAILLSAEHSSYDFGTISMKDGNVSHTFAIKNSSGSDVLIGKMYTSCMCTEATLSLGDEKFGPYGMPGHAAVPKINKSMAAGKEASVEVVFDPAAHGPAGVGRIQRSVVIENSGKTLELSFTATVTP